MVETGLRTESEEPIFDPGQAIIDSHHHLWSGSSGAPGGHAPYMLPELLADLRSGHNIRATVYIEAGSSYADTGPEHLRPVGETRFACRVGEEADAVGVRACAAIVAHADLTRGHAVAEVLDAHIAHGGGRMRGIRQMVTPRTMAGEFVDKRRLLLDVRFREGLSELEARGLSFEAMLFHHQHAGLIELTRSNPDLRIIVNHLGAPIHIGPYAGRKDEVDAAWRESMATLARSPNVMVKLGGIGLFTLGHDWSRRQHRVSSDEMVEATRDYFLHVIDQFGPMRCMFESNFPPDGQSASYRTLWNALKKVVQHHSPAERQAMFYDNAAKAYRIAV